MLSSDVDVDVNREFSFDRYVSIICECVWSPCLRAGRPTRFVIMPGTLQSMSQLVLNSSERQNASTCQAAEDTKDCADNGASEEARQLTIGDSAR